LPERVTVGERKVSKRMKAQGRNGLIVEGNLIEQQRTHQWRNALKASFIGA